MKAEINRWINDINARPDIAAINIGLIQTETDYQAYLIGSFEYDQDDDDWACNEDFVPSQKYLTLPNSAELSWQDVQNQITQIVSQILLTHSNNILTYSPVVTVGFDGAELIRIK